jgi:hypothetical protein
MERATIYPADAANQHKILGFRLLKALKGVPGVSPHDYGAWVHADSITIARERLAGAGYDVLDVTEEEGRTAPPRRGATDEEKAKERPPWCGRCNKETRHIEIGVERRPKRCPRCHPFVVDQQPEPDDDQDYVAPLADPLAPLTADERARSHEAWRQATRALGNDPDEIERREYARMVKCPHCGAPVGEACTRTVPGNRKKLDVPHPSRYQAADAALLADSDA